jgi:hypothetical protein
MQEDFQRKKKKSCLCVWLSGRARAYYKNKDNDNNACNDQNEKKSQEKPANLVKIMTGERQIEHEAHRHTPYT